MQVRFLLNKETIHKQKLIRISTLAIKCNTRSKAASFKVSEKSAVSNKEQIEEAIIFLEHLVKTLEKKVHYLKDNTTSLHTIPTIQLCKENHKKNY